LTQVISISFLNLIATQNTSCLGRPNALIKELDQLRQLHNIVLAGFMGTGKTSVGHALASLLYFRLIDTDELIESRSGKRISDIFAQEGEERFRQYEREIVTELSHYRKTVISTGGGLVVDPANMASLKTHALIACLWASPEMIYERVRHQSSRPLLQTPDPLGRIRSLLAERERAYREADVLVNTEVRSVREVAQQVAHQFRLEQEGSYRRESSNPAKGA
jgi:shikimate kinase